MKTCTKCGVEKPFESFQKDSYKPDGHRPACKDCVNEYLRDYRKRNAEKVRAQKKVYWDRHGEKYAPRRKAYYEKNKERESATALDYYHSNRERLIQANRQWKLENKDRVKATAAAYRKENMARSVAYSRKRYALKIQAIPSWVSFNYVDLFYAMAREEAERTGREVHVDHIVPLNSDLVCGLHCEDNLQLLFREDNLSKGNRWWPDMWDTE